jgi:hypothetical protein
MSPTLSAHGVSVSPPAGFEGRVFRRPAFGEVSASAADGPPAPPGEVPNTVVHVSTIALPSDTGDFAGGAVEHLAPDDVLVVLFEYDAASVDQPLFARSGMPRALTAGDFSPGVLQRAIPGQAGCQVFFAENGRAFCLYAVLGAYAQRAALVPKVNAVLATVVIEPRTAANAAPTTTTSPPSTPTTTTSPPSTSAPAGTTQPPGASSPSPPPPGSSAPTTGPSTGSSPSTGATSP